MALDALNREESCGGHFRLEFQTEEGEALRNDRDFAYVAAWEYKGPSEQPVMHKESLKFENIELKQRNYK
jgi:succinate dehydrogenase / fumarate reductase flavoprotein subunit